MLETLVVVILLSLLSLLGYVVKRGLDIVQFLIGMPESAQKFRPVAKEEDQSAISYFDESEVVSEHVADRHREADERAEKLRAELAMYAQDPRAGIYDVPHEQIDQTYVPRPTEEYAR